MVGIPEPIQQIIPNVSRLSVIVKYGAWIAAGIIVFLAGYLYWYNKKTYVFDITVFRRRGNERSVRKCKGGYIIKDKLRTFRIKWGRNILNKFITMPKTRKDLDYLPDTNLIDGNTFYFDQLDPDTYVQVRKFHLQKPTRLRKIKLLQNYGNLPVGEEITQYEHLVDNLVSNEIAEYIDVPNDDYLTAEEVYFEPVPRDTKAMAIQNIKGVSETLGTNMFKTTLIIGGLMVLGVTLIVTIFILSS